MLYDDSTVVIIYVWLEVGTMVVAIVAIHHSISINIWSVPDFVKVDSFNGNVW